MEIVPEGYPAADRPEVVNPAERIIETAVERARAAVSQDIVNGAGSFTGGGSPDLSTTEDGDGETLFEMIWGVDNWNEANWTSSQPVSP